MCSRDELPLETHSGSCLITSLSVSADFCVKARNERCGQLMVCVKKYAGSKMVFVYVGLCVFSCEAHALQVSLALPAYLSEVVVVVVCV